MRVDGRLLQPPHKRLGSVVLKALEAKLFDIVTRSGIFFDRVSADAN